MNRSHSADEADVVTQLFCAPTKDVLRIQILELEDTTSEEKEEHGRSNPQHAPVFLYTAIHHVPPRCKNSQRSEKSLPEARLILYHRNGGIDLQLHAPLYLVQ